MSTSADHPRTMCKGSADRGLSRRTLLKSVAAGSAVAASAPLIRSQGVAHAQEPVTLSFWSEWSADPERSVADALIEQFNAANPSIVVEHRPIENEQFFTVLRTGFTSGEPPDVFQHEGHNNLFQFSDLGEVEPIDDFWAENGDRFLPGTDASIKKGDTYFGVPWTIHTDTQIYYNDTLLTENGIDGAALATWDDYLTAFETLKAAGITPIAFANKFGWSGSQWFYAFLVRQVGVDPVLDLCARVGDYKWTDPGVVAAAQHYVDLNTNDYFSTGKASDDFPAAVALFFAGRAGFFQTGSWFLADAQASAPPDFQLGLNTFPTIEGGEGDPKQIVMQGLEGISVSKRGAEKNREAALAFIDFLTQTPQAETWVRDSVKVSPVAGAVNDETASPNLMKIVEGQIEGNTGSFPFLEHILPKTVGEEAIWMGSVGVLTGYLTAETWMEDVEATAESEPPVIER
jgi:ABC-type glycerol-3-phosphate transport system substrate-binding protein